MLASGKHARSRESINISIRNRFSWSSCERRSIRVPMILASNVTQLLRTSGESSDNNEVKTYRCNVHYRDKTYLACGKCRASWDNNKHDHERNSTRVASLDNAQYGVDNEVALVDESKGNVMLSSELFQSWMRSYYYFAHYSNSHST